MVACEALTRVKGPGLPFHLFPLSVLKSHIHTDSRSAGSVRSKLRVYEAPHSSTLLPKHTYESVFSPTRAAAMLTDLVLAESSCRVCLHGSASSATHISV